MWIKFTLAVLFAGSLVTAFATRPRVGHTARESGSTQKSLRLLSWNIGNGDLEAETRAHTEDLPAVARVILANKPDAVALQELSGEDQLKQLLAQLENRYRGFVSSRGSSDRVEALLITREALTGTLFNDVPSGNRFAAAATFRLHEDWPGVVLVSAHADAFSAAARRRFIGDVVDWSRKRTNDQIAFIAGDFNLEVGTRNPNNLFTDDAKHDSESYAYLLRFFADLGREAGETSVNDRRIDYIFGPGSKVKINRAEVLRDAAVGHMDHWPLLVEVGL
jgi:endonuclease/exonuclease/phosphatase family metal-dependent hydrolase